MKELTSNDIEALKKYLTELEKLEKNKPDKLTDEEWKNIFSEIFETNKIPKKYVGRIVENKVTVYSKRTHGKHIQFPDGIKQTVYYDKKEEEYNAKCNRLHEKYQKHISKVLANDNSEATNVSETIKKIILEKEQSLETKMYSCVSIPNGEALDFMFKVLKHNKNGEPIESSRKNRHENIIFTKNKAGDVAYTRTNKGQEITIKISQWEKHFNNTNTPFIKILLFVLQQMTAQGLPLEFGFSMQKMVDLKMYKNISNASRAIKKFFDQQKEITLSGTVKKGKKIITEEGGILFYHYKIKNGFVTVYVNENFNMEFIANYYTFFPKFAFALSGNAFVLFHYIFSLARQNTKSISEKNTFKISLESVRHRLMLPTAEEVEEQQHRKYKEKIINPIEDAIEKIESELENVPESEKLGLTITPIGIDASNINECLQGHLEIGLNGNFAEIFKKIEEARQKQIAKQIKKSDKK